MADLLPVVNVSSTPMWRAMALRWIGALVEPPMAELTTNRVVERLARQDVRRLQILPDHLDDALAGVDRRICPRSRYGAGIAAEPGNDMPSASVSEFIVVAVPMVLQ